VTPDGGTVYVASADYAGGAVTSISTATDKAGTPIPDDGHPVEIVVTT
jgi:DNA-binding beta-propeller fold protein YncE